MTLFTMQKQEKLKVSQSLKLRKRIINVVYVINKLYNSAQFVYRDNLNTIIVQRNALKRIGRITKSVFIRKNLRKKAGKINNNKNMKSNKWKLKNKLIQVK